MICREEAGGETAYIQGFVNGCKKQKNANDAYCHLETDRSNVWGRISQLNTDNEIIL